MALIFLGMFYLLVFTGFFENLILPLRIGLGIIFLAYSAFRIWQILTLLKNQKND